MVSLRSSAPPTTSRSSDLPMSSANKRQTTRGRYAATLASSSSSAKGVHTLQSDENVPQARRALGDIKNVVAEPGRSPRKPLSDRNAPLPLHHKPESKKMPAPKSRSASASTKPSPAPSTLNTRSARPRREPLGPATQSNAPAFAAVKRARQPRSPSPQQLSHVQVPSVSSSMTDDALSAHLSAADLHAENIAPSHAELTRLSPGLNSDDLEYFDVSILQQTQTEPIPTTQHKRMQTPTSKHDNSERDSTPSHGASDKENVPPPAVRPGRSTAHRRTTRSAVGVLREQPMYSTPLSQKRKPLYSHRSGVPQTLDDIFLDESDASSQVDSPGAARRTASLTASAQQLLDYKDQGVNKVKAWKAAGHHTTATSDKQSKPDSWPPEHEDANLHMDAFDDDDLDEFGFLHAERKLRDRATHLLVDSFEYNDNHLGIASDVFIDIPTDPFDTSDDRRLAEHVFGRMSSPALRPEASSTAAESGLVGVSAEHEQSFDEVGLRETPRKRAREADVLEEVTEQRRSTRSGRKRVTPAKAMVEGSRDTALSTPPPPPPPSTRKGGRRGDKTKRAVSGIPLRRNQTKEQEVLEKLAAEASSSPSNSSAPSSPNPTRTSKKNMASPAANQLRMDDILGFLPRRSRTEPAAKPSGSKRKNTPSRTSRAGTASTPRTKPTKRGRKNTKSTTPIGDDESRPATRRNTRASAKIHNPRDGPLDEDERERSYAVNSSQIHSDDSERTRRIKEVRAADKYHMEVERVL